MAKKSETLAQREKAQRDLLELKKMQQGQMEIKRDDDKKIVPMTLDEKAENFFFYHKYKIMAGIAAAIVLFIIFYSIFSTPDYDATLTIYCHEYVSETEIKNIGKWANEIYVDVNDNGSVDVLTTDCSFDATAEEELAETIRQRQMKLHSLLTEPEAMLFILNEDSLKYFAETEATKNLFKEENIVELPAGFYEALGENRVSLKKEVKRYLCLRNIEGTNLDKKAKTHYEAAKQVLENVKNGELK